MTFIQQKLGRPREDSARDVTSWQSRYRYDPATVMQQLRQRLVGQHEALQRLEDTLYRIKAELHRPELPLAVMLLIGPTGVGKTSTVRELASALHGDSSAFCRIDMNTLSQAHYAASLAGAPPGYVGSKEGHSLLDKARIEGSFSTPGIVLFDELEKADDEVLKVLLSVFDSGLLRLGSGQQTISFNNTLVFCTSNVGSQALQQRLQRYQRGWRAILGLTPDPAAFLDTCLHQRFTPEFINRFDHVVHYQSLPQGVMAHVAELELSRITKRLQQRHIDLRIEPSVYAWLSDHYDRRYGARDIHRIVRRWLEPQLARVLLADHCCSCIIVRIQSGKLQIVPS